MTLFYLIVFSVVVLGPKRPKGSRYKKIRTIYKIVQDARRYKKIQDELPKMDFTTAVSVSFSS